MSIISRSKLSTFSESVEWLSRKCALKLAERRHIIAICSEVELAGDVICGCIVKSIKVVCGKGLSSHLSFKMWTLYHLCI